MPAPRAKNAKPARRPPLAALIRRSSTPLSVPVADGASEVAAKASAPKAAAAPARWVRLDTDVPTQEQSNWCWAATSLGVHRFYDRTDTTRQCDAANLILPADDACVAPAASTVNKPWYLDDALSDLGNLREPVVTSVLGFTDLRAEIDRGTPLATRIGWAGGGGHFMVVNGYRGATTRMVAIDDPIYGRSDMTYDAFRAAYQGAGTWTHSYRTRSHRLRVPGARTVPAGRVTAVSRKSHLLDLFMVDVHGHVLTAASDAEREQGQWRGWSQVQGGQARPGARVACVARAAGLLDIFVVGTDGGIWTAAWDAAQSADAWRGWWRIGSLEADPGAHIAAVSRHPDKLDVFVVDVQGRVMTAAWQRGDAQWRGWRTLQNGTAPSGAPIEAVARGPEKLDVFVTGADGRIFTAGWDALLARGAWRGWFEVRGGRAAPAAPVSAVVRDAGVIEIIAGGADGQLHTTASQGAAGEWRVWSSIAGVKTAQGSAVACIAFTPERQALVVISVDGALCTATGDTTSAGTRWHGWQRIGGGAFAPGIAPAVVSRTPTSLDVFCVGADGDVYAHAWDAALAGGHWRG